MPYFHGIDYIPWIGSMIAEWVIVAAMLRRGLIRHFPVFFGSVVFDLLREMILPIVAAHSALAYGYCYWISIPIEYVIAFGVMLEAVRYSLGADPKIPSKTLRGMAVTAVLLVVAAIFLLLHPDIPGSNMTAIIVTVDRSIGLLRCGVLLFIWVFARKLGLSWKHHVWGIVLGLGIYSSISLITAAIHATTGTVRGDWLTRFPPFSYFAATIIWAIYLWRPEPQRGPLTLEEISFFNNSVATYRRILAELWRSFRNDGN